MIVPSSSEFEKFSTADLTGLREELLHGNLDFWQAADVISHYLSTKGYGVSPRAARTTASRLESSRYNVELMQAEFEQIALMM
ncbi:hypothetical protein JAO29_22365 [Edaphobacter sp. HDX4]|uniref:hypothetical protein n=1 Tax=Edaphobacter sp. HDX4 TaxID=2794064 RepID=UPI002FE62219